MTSSMENYNKEADKLLSIVIPSYNMENYLPNNLAKLIKAKEIDKIEIIIVNDGSTDSTLSIARSFQEKAPQSIVVVDKKNGHYGSCLNAAIKIAKGKYFRILDADDWFETESLDLFMEKLAHTDSDLVVTLRVEQLTTKDGSLKPHYLPIKGVEYGKEYNAKTFSVDKYSESVEFNMHSMTYKTDIVRKSGLVLPEGICYTDLLYCLVPVSSINTLVVYDIYLYNYLVGREGNSTNDSALKKNLSHIVAVLHRMIEYMGQQDAQSLAPAVLDNQQRYLREAIGLFTASIMMHRHISKELYADIAPIVDYCKANKAEHRLWKKYYNRYWLKNNTCFSLNFCLLYRMITHPFH